MRRKFRIRILSTLCANSYCDQLEERDHPAARSALRWYFVTASESCLPSGYTRMTGSGESVCSEETALTIASAGPSGDGQLSLLGAVQYFQLFSALKLLLGSCVILLPDTKQRRKKL